MAQKINIVCVSGMRERLQMAAMIASVAAAIGDEVWFFFSLNALPPFLKGGAATDAPAEATSARSSGKACRRSGNCSSRRPISATRAVAVLDGDGPVENHRKGVARILGPPTGLTRFLSDAEGGQLLSF